MSSALTSHSVSFLFSCVICTELQPTEKSRPAQFFIDISLKKLNDHNLKNLQSQRAVFGCLSKSHSAHSDAYTCTEEEVKGSL